MGAESRDQTKEPHAPDTPEPDWIQPFTMIFALERRPPNENHTIDKPAEYEQMKAGQKYTIIDGSIDRLFPSMWQDRRYIAAAYFDDARFPYDLTTINTYSNDFQREFVPVDSPEELMQVVADGKLASLEYLYRLQTECPHPDSTAIKG